MEIISVSVKDTGRVSSMPEGPVIAIIGSPGSGADKIASRLTEKYTGFVHITVSDSVSNLFSHPSSISTVNYMYLLHVFVQNVSLLYLMGTNSLLGQSIIPITK